MTPLRRTGALVASAALAVSGVALAAAPAEAAVDPRPVTIGADWVADHLVNGIVVSSYLDFFTGDPVEYDDLGLTMDAAMSLVNVGGHAADVTAIRTALEPRITETYESFGTTYTGSTAKAAVYTRLVGGDPNNANAAGEGEDPVDLIGVILENIRTTGPSAGRITNLNDSFGDANTFGQSFAVRALAEDGTELSSENAAAAEEFLLKQQCTAGFFRLNWTADADAADQTCQGAVGTDISVPDTDATSIAVLQLDALETKSAEVAQAITAARAWLLDQQGADGSFGGGPSTSAPNANSTGLAGQALAGGSSADRAAAVKAAIWVRGLQVDEPASCPSELSAETGGIGYDAATVAAGRADGITLATKDRWLRTTLPALPVLELAPTATESFGLEVQKNISPAGYWRGGSSIGIRAVGLAPGDKVCVSRHGALQTLSADGVGEAFFFYKLPNASVNRAVAVRNRAGNTISELLKVLGPKTLKVTSTTAHLGRSMKVRVAGLAPGERVTVKFRGVVKATGAANLSGEFVTSFGVWKPTGPTPVSGLGEFPSIRKGYKMVNVLP